MTAVRWAITVAMVAITAGCGTASTATSPTTSTPTTAQAVPRTTTTTVPATTVPATAPPTSPPSTATTVPTTSPPTTLPPAATLSYAFCTLYQTDQSVEVFFDSQYPATICPNYAKSWTGAGIGTSGLWYSEPGKRPADNTDTEVCKAKLGPITAYVYDSGGRYYGTNVCANLQANNDWTVTSG